MSFSLCSVVVGDSVRASDAVSVAVAVPSGVVDLGLAPCVETSGRGEVLVPACTSLVLDLFSSRSLVLVSLAGSGWASSPDSSQT